MTGREMCETIHRAMVKTDPGKAATVTALGIWNMSPTGELWPVFELYEWAQKVLGEAR